MTRFRLPILIATLVLLYTPTSAQNLVACTGGTANGFPCNEIDFAAQLPLSTFNSTRGADIWGWTDPQTGNEIALAAFEEGTAFVDVTDPSSPVNLGFLPTQSFSSTWRDVKVYADHAFIVADNAGSHGVQIFDLTRLRTVSNPPETFSADEIYTGIGSAHNIVINEDTGFAYAVGADDCNGSLHMINIQAPTNPAYAGCFGDDGYTHDAQCVSYIGPDTDYAGREICVGAQGTFSSSSHIVVVDVTDKNNPSFVSQGNYTDAVYAHQGWFTDDQKYFFLGDEIDDGASATTRTIVFDMTDLDNPEVAFYYYGPVETTDHNLYIRGKYAFLSNYESGLRIVDLTNIDSGTISEVASFDTYPQGNGESYNGQWSNYPFFESGNIIANDRDNGLFVLKPTFPITTSNDAPELTGDKNYSLSSAYPNPFTETARMTLTIDESQHVDAELIDITGRSVAKLFDGAVASGKTLDLTIDGSSLPSGLYLVRIQGETFNATQRVSLVHN